MKTTYFGGGSGGPPGGVTSVFGRTGAVVASNGDYDTDQVTNASGVTGLTCSDALDNLASSIAAIATAISITAGQLAIGTGTGIADFPGVAVGDVPAWDGSSWVSTTLIPIFNIPTLADEGAIPVVNGAQNFNYVEGTAGQALIYTAGTWAPGSDFGATQLTTTGSFRGNASGAFLQLGTNPGSGATEASAVGGIRLRDGGSCYYHDTTLGADVRIFDASANTINIGGPATLNVNATSIVNVAVGGNALACSTGAVRVGKDTLWFAASLSGTVDFGYETQSSSGSAMNIHGQGCTASGSTGGNLEVFAGDNGATAGTHKGGKLTLRGGDNTSSSGTPQGSDVLIRPGRGGGGVAGNIELFSIATTFGSMRNGCVWGPVENQPTTGPGTNELFIWNNSSSFSWKTDNLDVIEWTSSFSTTVGAAGGASALPATPTLYLRIEYENAGGARTGGKIPVYAV